MNSVFEGSTYLFTYMFIYNISMTVVFWTLFNTIVSEFKTLYSFSNLSFNSFYVLVLTVLLLSMAGVPPFIGFFSKLFIITLLINSSFFLFYSLFFVLLLIGLYFYVQNLRFLHSTNLKSSDYPYADGSERLSIAFFYVTVVVLFVLGLGIFYIDDLLLFFSWLLI